MRSKIGYPSFTRSLLYLHELVVAEAMNARPGLHVLDVGGGNSTPFALHRIPTLGTWLVGSDILAQQLLQVFRPAVPVVVAL